MGLYEKGQKATIKVKCIGRSFGEYLENLKHFEEKQNNDTTRFGMGFDILNLTDHGEIPPL